MTDRGFLGECPCGSGKFADADYDGHGIFLFYACEDCHNEKISHYRTDIYEAYECDEPIEEDY